MTRPEYNGNNVTDATIQHKHIGGTMALRDRVYVCGCVCWLCSIMHQVIHEFTKQDYECVGVPAK